MTFCTINSLTTLYSFSISIPLTLSLSPTPLSLRRNCFTTSSHSCSAVHFAVSSPLSPPLLLPTFSSQFPFLHVVAFDVAVVVACILLTCMWAHASVCVCVRVCVCHEQTAGHACMVVWHIRVVRVVVVRVVEFCSFLSLAP